MEINHTRPVQGEGDARGARTQATHRPFSPGRTEPTERIEVQSDANTRLSREVDRADISDEARELYRHDDGERSEGEVSEPRQG